LFVLFISAAIGTASDPAGRHEYQFLVYALLCNKGSMSQGDAP